MNAAKKAKKKEAAAYVVFLFFACLAPDCRAMQSGARQVKLKTRLDKQHPPQNMQRREALAMPGWVVLAALMGQFHAVWLCIRRGLARQES